VLRAPLRPKRSNWLNLVERWFGHLESKAIRRGVFRSVEDLKASIDAFLTAWNKDPKAFVRTAVESIAENLRAAHIPVPQLSRVMPGTISADCL